MLFTESFKLWSSIYEEILGILGLFLHNDENEAMRFLRVVYVNKLLKLQRLN